MDSMRHLSTSLPPTRRRQEQPELLADFKAAALSVTTLYKSAAASQASVRAAGYQDALDDLLAFLDHENLGLMDGEGWRVRRWATERLTDGGGQQRPQAGGGEMEEAGREEQRTSSPEIERKPSTVVPPSSDLTEDTQIRRASVSEPPQQRPITPQSLSYIAPARDDFAFRSFPAYPANHDREGTNMEVDTTASTPTSTESVRFIPRANRVRHTGHQRQRNVTAPSASITLGSGAGSKRKLPYADFFDISGFNGSGDGQDRKDAGAGGGGGGGRGGKRGRHV